MREQVKSYLEVTCSKKGKTLRFQMFIPFEEFQGLFRMVKITTQNNGIFYQVSKKGIKPTIDFSRGLGNGGLSYDTRISSTEFDGLKPGEKRRYEVDVPMPLYIEAKEEK